MSNKSYPQLENIFGKPANIYIDWQNVLHWQEKLNWHFDTKRIKQFFDSFNTMNLFVGQEKFRKI